jgi:quercetin dioxygenase-like cupin family protein
VKQVHSRFGVIAALALVLAASMSALAGYAAKYLVKPVAEKKIASLPSGPLYWRVETFPTLVEAKAAVGPDGWDPASVSYATKTALIAEVAGKVYVTTLGAKGDSTPGGAKLAEIGPLPPLNAPEYLLRLNYGSGPPGSTTPVHSHPGSESFYVISGRLGQKTTQGTNYVDAGHTMNGHAADTTMQVFNAGQTDLQALNMFVVDARKPFSVPRKFAGDDS